MNTATTLVESHTRRMRQRLLACTMLALATLTATPAHAQLNGENLLGDTGIKNGSQPTPGFYVSNLFYRYSTDTIKDPAGNKVVFDPSQPGSQKFSAVAPLLTYVSRAKVLGANYGMMAVMPFANGSLEAPAFGLQEDVSTGPSDLYVMPLQLGWHLSRAEATAAFAFFAPTGRYQPGGDDNLGKGMWSYELSAGTTVYVDKRKTVSVATTAFWETHSKKEGTNGVRVGQLLTLEGGVGRSFLEGAAHVGLAYYAQWKLTHDDLGLPDTLTVPPLPRHQVWGFGPDVTIPIATKSRLISLVNVRYFWETGAEVKTEGQSLVVTATFPVPGIKIPSRP